MIDTSSLFLHILAAIGIVGGGIVQVLGGIRLRAARTARDVAVWSAFTRSAGWLIVLSAAVSLLTGGHLAGAVWTTEARSGFSHPFITLGVIGLVVLVPVGPMIGGARLRRLADATDAIGSAPIPPGLLAEARSTRLWGPIHSLVGVGVGIVALMVYKPSWGGGVTLLVLTFAAGWVVGSVVAVRATRGSGIPERSG